MLWYRCYLRLVSSLNVIFLAVWAFRFTNLRLISSVQLLNLIRLLPPYLEAILAVDNFDSIDILFLNIDVASVEIWLWCTSKTVWQVVWMRFLLCRAVCSHVTNNASLPASLGLCWLSYVYLSSQKWWWGTVVRSWSTSQSYHLRIGVFVLPVLQQTLVLLLPGHSALRV